MTHRNICLIGAIAIFTTMSAQEKKMVKKEVDVRVENGATTVNMSETIDGKTTTQVLTGRDAEEYVASEKAEARAITSGEGVNGGSKATVIKEIETEDENGDKKVTKRYMYATAGETEDIYVTDGFGEGEGFSSEALKMDVSDDEQSLSVACMPTKDGMATLTIEGPGEKLISKEEVSSQTRIDRRIDLKKHGKGDYTAKLEQGGTVIVKKLVIE